MDILSILPLLGGIGLFLFGMDLMGSYLTKLAGSSLEKILERFTTGNVTYITPICEAVQGNYRVTAQAGILTVEGGTPKTIRLVSDWPEGKPAYAGTQITMTAELTGFEDTEYTLQWQYSTDLNEWTSEPGANGTSFTFELDETTVQYTWRVVASY